VRACPLPGLVVPHGFVKQVLVDFGPENFVGQLQLADLLIV
jgi:hypothetical protein